MPPKSQVKIPVPNRLGVREHMRLANLYFRRIIAAAPLRAFGHFTRSIGAILCLYPIIKSTTLFHDDVTIPVIDDLMSAWGAGLLILGGFTAASIGNWAYDRKGILGKLKGSWRLPPPPVITLYGNTLRALGFVLRSLPAAGFFLVRFINHIAAGNGVVALLDLAIAAPTLLVGAVLYDYGNNVKWPRNAKYLTPERRHELHLDDLHPWERSDHDEGAG